MKKILRFQYLRILPVLLVPPLIYLGLEWSGIDEGKKSSLHGPSAAMGHIGSLAPPFSIDPPYTSHGKPFQLKEVLGKPLVLHFWATWCAPCLEELPLLAEAAKIWKPKGYTFVTIANDESWKAVEEFLQQYPKLKGIEKELLILVDPQAKISNLYGSNRFPETYLINDKQIIDNKLLGAQPWAQAKMKDLLSTLATQGGSP